MRIGNIISSLTLKFRPQQTIRQEITGHSNQPHKLKAFIFNLNSRSLTTQERIAVAEAIKDGMFGTNPEVLSALAHSLQFLTIEIEAQLLIATAVSEGKFGANPEVLNSLARAIKNCCFISSNAQQIITLALATGKLGNDPKVLTALATNMNLFITEKAAYSNIIVALQKNCFGNEVAVLIELAISLSNMALTPVHKSDLSTAISEGKFGTHPTVVAQLVTTIEKLQLTAKEKYVKKLASAIISGVFSHDLAALAKLSALIQQANFSQALIRCAVAIATKFHGNTIAYLNNHDFDNLEAQQDLTLNLQNDKFANHPETLKALARRIASINFTSENKRLLATAIREQRFGNNTEVLAIIATAIPKLKFTTAEDQLNIIMTLDRGNFTNDPSILAIVARNLKTMNFTHSVVQQELAKAIHDGKFGANPEVLNELALSLASCNFSDLDALQTLALTIATGKFGDPLPIALKAAISTWILKPEVFAAICSRYPQLFNHDHSQLALKLEEYSYQYDVQAPQRTIEAIAIDECFSSDATNTNRGMVSYGITYNKIGQPDFLIIYSADLQPGKANIQEIQENFAGFFSVDAEHKMLYQNNLRQIKIFALAPNTYPVLLEKSSIAQQFKTFPAWLQTAIISNEFNPEAYNSPALLQFVLSFVNESLASHTELRNQCNSIISSIIMGQGGTFNLSRDPSYDIQIKDAINNAFDALNPSKMESYSTQLQRFWETLTTTADKLKLAFLLGQIAKKGALGYHHHRENDENNQANMAFYALAARCIDWLLRESSPEITLELRTKLNNISSNLTQGMCIEVASNDLRLAYPEVNLVWEKPPLI